MYECGDVLLKAYESRSEEGGMLVMINDCCGESGQENKLDGPVYRGLRKVVLI